MSFSANALLWLHVAAAIFAIGPGTAAIMSTPRYIRKRNTVIVDYLRRITRIYTAAALLVLIFGLILAQLDHDLTKWWVTASTTLFVVAIVLLALIMRDQRKAIHALTAPEAPATQPPGRSAESKAETPGEGEAAGGPQPAPAPAVRVAAVEQARIASMSGVVALLWLVTLVFMVWK